MNIPVPFQNFFKLLKYGIVSQALYFLTIPIILKKYDASEYGIFTIVFSISAVIGTLSALRLERAIVVEDKNQIKLLLIKCSTYIVFFSLTCSLILFFALKPFNLATEPSSLLIILGGLYCLLFGFQQVFVHLAIRQEKLTITGMSDALYSLLLVIFLFFLPNSLYQQSVILIVIFTLSRLLSLLPFLKLEIKSYLKTSPVPDLTFKELRKYHIPVLTVFLSNIQFKGLFYLTGIYYGGATTGQIAMSQRVVYSPVNLIGAALRKSFFLEFTKQKKDDNTVNGYISKILNYGSIVSIFILPVFILSASYLKTYIPEGWEASIPFAIALYPVASILVLLSWLDRLYDAKKKQATALLYEFVYTFILYAILLTALSHSVSALSLLLFFTVITVIYNLTWATLTLRMINAKRSTIILPAILHSIMLISCILYLR